MRTTVFILSAFAALLFLGASFANAQEWQKSVITNETDENVYVVRSTWKAGKPKKGFPRGFRTRGTYRIRPGKSRSFYSWADNSIYFRIANSAGALKPESSASTSHFWVHPDRSFRLVSEAFDTSVTVDQLLYSDHSGDVLVHSDGFLRYSSGSDVTVTSAWVSLSGEPVSLVNEDDENDNTDNSSSTPAIQQDTGPAGMVLIPAGTFQMGSTTGDTDESPVHPVSVEAFHMDTHEVTNAEYAAFLNAKGKHADAGHTWLSLGSSDVRIELIAGTYRAKTGYANHPVVRVSWYGAMAYAAWAGKRLPTEAEWEYAARGGLAGKQYPWGDTIDTTQANYGWNIADTTPGGTYAANGYGLYDMAGNVFEWCLDTYLDNFYDTSPAQNPLSGDSTIIDTYTTVDSQRVLRGGSWFYSASVVRVSNRDYSFPMSTGGDLGFRCVKSVPAAPVAPVTPTPVLAETSDETDDNNDDGSGGDDADDADDDNVGTNRYTGNFIVDCVYFKPSDAEEIATDKIKRTIEAAQALCAEEMNRHGFGRKTFRLDRDTDGEIIIHKFNGRNGWRSYSQTEDTYGKLKPELPDRFNEDTPPWNKQDRVRLIIVGGAKFVDGNLWGVGWSLSGYRCGGTAIIAGNSRGLTAEVIFHELGHTFGLFHKPEGMDPYALEEYEARWLDKHYHFNDNERNVVLPSVDQSTLKLTAVGADTIKLEIAAAADLGLHQAKIYRLADIIVIGHDYFNGEKNAIISIQAPRHMWSDRMRIRLMDRQGNYIAAPMDIQLPAPQSSALPKPQPSNAADSNDDNMI